MVSCWGCVCVKKKCSNASCLPYPKVTDPEESVRAQRHVPDSIRTLHLALAAGLGWCNGARIVNAGILICDAVVLENKASRTALVGKTAKTLYAKPGRRSSVRANGRKGVIKKRRRVGSYFASAFTQSVLSSDH